MRMGLGVGIGLAPRQSALAALNFTNAARVGGAFTLPTWLAITCATAGRTSQTSASAIATGFGANAARARSADGTTWGLSVEASRKNNNVDTRLDQAGVWSRASFGTGTVVAATGPSGASDAYLLTNDGTAGFIVATLTLPTATMVMSVWELVNAPAPGAAVARVNANAGSMLIDRGTVDAAFVRRDISGAVTAGNFNSVLQPRALAAAGSLTLYGYQIETGKYPGSVIPTAGAAVTRAADVLSVASPSVIAPGGFFDLTIVVAPNYATAEQAADHDLLFFDTNNRVFIQQSTAKVVLRIGGADVLSSALTWSREQGLTIRAAHKASGRTLTVSGATTGNGTATGGAASAISLPGTAYLLGNASGAEECSDLRSVLFAV